MKIFLNIALLGATLLSCSSNQLEPPYTEYEVLKIRTNIETKATINSFATNSQLGLFVTKGSLRENYDENKSYTNVRSTLLDGVWVQSYPVYLTNENATIYAYYPWNATAVDGKAISIESDSQTDYMYGKNADGQSAIKIGNSTVKLAMKHVLALVQFNIKSHNYFGEGKVTKIEIVNGSSIRYINSKGTMNIESGVTTNIVGDTSSVIIENENDGLLFPIPETLINDESLLPKVMLLPTNSTLINGDIYVNFTIDGKVYKWDVPAFTSWKSGTKNTYTVTISGSSISVGPIIVSEWDNYSQSTIF